VFRIAPGEELFSKYLVRPNICLAISNDCHSTDDKCCESKMQAHLDTVKKVLDGAGGVAQ
jgi:hypothetical protein